MLRLPKFSATLSTYIKIARPLRTKGNALLKRFVFGAVILRFLYKNAVQSPIVPSPLILGAVTQTGDTLNQGGTSGSVRGGALSYRFNSRGTVEKCKRTPSELRKIHI